MPDRLFDVGPQLPRDRKLTGQISWIGAQHIAGAEDRNSTARVIVLAGTVDIINHATESGPAADLSFH